MADDMPLTPSADDPKPYYDYHQKEAEKHQQMALEDEQVAQDVLHNPRYDQFFAPYHPRVRTNFVRDYVSRRHLWRQYGDSYERHLTGQLTQFETEAYTRLWDIQQKKLFDLQCQWRAELITVPGVRYSGDFNALAGRIENCDAVPPITEAELEMYLAWVRQANYGEDLYEPWGGRFEWQDHGEVKRKLNPSDDDDDENAWSFSEISEWYSFHSLHTGGERLLNLPDLRGEKEEYYLRAWQKRERQQPAPDVAAAPAAPLPTYAPEPEREVMQGEFARQFESSQLNRQRDAYETANPPDEWEDEELDRMLDFLKELRLPVPIEAGADWRVAVREAAYNYRKQQLLQNLPTAFEAYCQRREWGIAQPSLSEQEYTEYANFQEKCILDGRELLGEPRNFDF